MQRRGSQISFELSQIDQLKVATKEKEFFVSKTKIERPFLGLSFFSSDAVSKIIL